MKIDIKQTLPCELGVSLEILQTLSKVLSKLGPNSYVFKSLFSFFLFVFFFWGEREWARRFSKLSPNWLQTHMRAKRFSLLFLEQECVWSDLETLQTQLSWNTNARTTNILFLWSRVEMFKCFHATSEWVWTFSKLSPNPFQIQVFPAILKRTKGSACAWPTAHIFVSRRRRSATLSLSKIFQISKPRTKKGGSAYAGLGPECFFE